MSTKVGSLEIEMAANIARLTEDFSAAKAEVNKSVGEIQRSVDRMRTDIESHMTKVGAAVNLVGNAFAAVAVVAAGGAMFGAAVSESVKLTMEANSLAKALGISATEASVLNVALGDIYQSSETMLAASNALTKQLVKNEDAFKGLGVATRDQNGNFRSSLDIMLDVNKRLMHFKEGTDRNIEGMKVYGKAWGEVQGVLKLNAELMDESRKKAAELGLIVGQENVAATARYRAAMNDVGDVISAVKKAIGDVLLPILTDLGNWFSEIGPQAVTATKIAVGGLASAFYGLKMVVEIAWEIIRTFVETSVIRVVSFAEAAQKALAFDFAGAKAAWKNGSDAIAENFDTALNRIVAKAETNRDKIFAILADAHTATTAKTGGAHSSGADEKDKKAPSRMSEFEAELNARKDALEKENILNKTYFEFSKEEELRYWQSILNIRGLKAEDIAAVNKKVLEAEHAINKEAGQVELDEIRKRAEQYKQGTIERVQAEAEAAAKIAHDFGFESKEYRKALDEMLKAAQARAKQQEQLDQMALEAARQHDLVLLDMERERLGLSRGLGEINAVQELQALRALKEQEFQIELQAEQDKAKLLEDDAIAYRQHLDRIAQIKQKHDLDMQKMNNQVILEQKKEFDQMFAPLTSAFEKSISGIIQGTLTLTKALHQMAQSVALEFANMGVKMVVDWVKNEAFKTQASAAGAAARSGIEQAAASQSLAVSAMTSIKSILNSAWETMASVYKSISEIPMVGPFMAPAMAAGAFAVVAGVAGNIASSEGGDWMIPGDRMNIVHAQETILPADKSRGLDELISRGTQGGDTIHVHAMDARSFQRFLTDNRHALSPALQKLSRQFVKV